MKKNRQKQLTFVSLLLALLLVFSTSLVENRTAYASTTLYGVALKEPTKVYGSTSTSSNALKSYAKGSILKYEAHNSNWYRAVVYVNGKRTTGYIAKADVDTATTAATTLNGIALKSSTKVYEAGSTNSKALKSYPIGSILKYQTFSKDWYQATVYVNGKKKSGYIHKSHVENALEQQESFRGIALKSKTAVYKDAGKKSQWKSYNQGTILKYTTFTTNWYSATVYVNGKKQTGYIHKSDVETAIPANEQKTAHGIGVKQTTVYSYASTNASKLKSYEAGSILKYNTFSNNWYEVTIYVSGKKTTGYIQNSNIEKLFETSKALEGVGLKSPTRIYEKASTSSKTLKSYTKGTILKFQTLSDNWYEAKVYINGKATKGYIHRNDVTLDNVITTTTAYSTNFNNVVETQFNKSAQVSGKNGGWVDASKEQISYYVNSSNFSKNSNGYYQFLSLSEPAGLNATEVNNKILINRGVLQGKAQKFIEAGKKYNINEAYLISHALLETGNGTSDLAKGVFVDKDGNVVAKEDAVHTVYNLFGIGATDDCPLECGAKRAFEKQWFSVDEAIIGGAEFIGTGYIDKGQNTLYKMRWNPVKPGDHQYATDIAWAVKQTSNLKKIYDLLDRYVLFFDVPKYAGQPSKSGDPNAYLPEPPKPAYPAEVKGLVESGSTALNMRPDPSTSKKEIAKIPNGSIIEVLAETTGQTVGASNLWYKVKFDGKTGYVHSDYVKPLNLLEVTATNINVRKDAGTAYDAVGSVKNADKLAAVLDAKNNIQTKSANGHIWYYIYFNGEKAWVSGGKNGTEYIKVK
ncbi:SH3 domain-containing protein [Bacillus niameyensis]|uniref:SH3 domain-containing protein n=1 Tax=Bacillus niameyensis TaxID=1522308 RepID=UPI000A52EF4D|nr:SH3 domain-containing protein [Bacillus niameyensis]